MKFENTINGLLAFAATNNLKILERKKINYGEQFRIGSADGTAAPVNIYNGKKGVSVVVGGSSGTLKQLLEEYFRTGTAAPAAPGKKRDVIPEPRRVPGLHAANGDDWRWAGSDEAGKGDYFGPLVVAAVSLNMPAAKRLKTAGVADCKKLSDDKVHKLAGIIRREADVCYSVAALMPEQYNSRYAEFANAGHNLNDLLASLHGQCARELCRQDGRIRRYIVDRFTDDYKLSKWLELPGQTELVNVTKAESDTAVAAASVLARSEFLKQLAELGEVAGMALPKGAGYQVNACAARLAKDNTAEYMEQFVKKHFKNSRDVAGLLNRLGE